MRVSRSVLVGAAGLGLSGCVAAVPVQPTLTVIPGQGKTEANLRADDVACRGAAPQSATGTSSTPASQAPAVTADQYYACMASRGESVIQQQTQVYPAYAYAAPAYVPYAYPAVAYPYPYYGYGYPYGYFGPYVGFGIGFRFGGSYGHDYGYRGGYGHGGFGHGGFHR